MEHLPEEILYEIVFLCFAARQSLSALLTASSLFRDTCQRIIYSNLHFTSRKQLLSFISTYSATGTSMPLAPRTLKLDITGEDSHLVFIDIHALFTKSFTEIKDAERDEQGRVSLDLLRLRLNSHAFDFKIQMIYEALSLVNPRRFIWTGPDPPHHFSIAIVPQAIPHLFLALESYTNLVYLKLSHFNMAYTSPSNKALPVIPSLRQLHIGQVIFLNPLAIIHLLADPNSANLEHIYLVDAYLESIWGPRLRRSDIEAAAENDATSKLEGYESGGLDVVMRRRIYDTVISEAATERIIGGDRVENKKLLL